MRKANFVILALCLYSTVFVYSQEMVLLWPEGKMPNSKGIKLTDSVAQQRLYQVGIPRMYTYLAPKEKNMGAAVLIVPGGGYVRLPETYDNNPTAEFFQNIGISAFVVCHRLPTSRDLIVRQIAPLQDAQRAMKIIRANAEKWGIDPNRVIANGTSAGGHVASSLGTHFEDVSKIGDSLDAFDYKPNFMMLISPVISFDDAIAHKGSKQSLLGNNPSEELVNKYSNETRVTNQSPPSFLVHADNDDGVSPFNSVVLYEALKKAGVSASLHIFPYGAHGIGVGRNPGSTDMWPAISIEWMKEMKIIQ